MKKENLSKLIQELEKEGKWNHYFEFSNGIQTIPKEDIPKSKGANIKKWERIKTLINENNFKNKTVLDIGCSDGYFSLMTSKLAKKVTGIDLDYTRIKKANFIKSYFRLKNCDFFHKDLNEFKNENFDIILLLGLLHRLPDPITFLEKTSKICNEIIIEYKCTKSKEILAFYGGAQKKGNDLNRLYFIFTPNCLENILNNFGFKIVSSEKFSFLNKLKFPRHIIHAKKI